MAKLTAKQLETLTPADDGKTLREDGGLVAKVRAGVRGVTVLFRYEFKMGGTKRDHRLGSWPKKSQAQSCAHPQLKTHFRAGAENHFPK